MWTYADTAKSALRIYARHNEYNDCICKGCKEIRKIIAEHIAERDHEPADPGKD